MTKPEYQETQRVAAEIERRVAGVMTSSSRNEISIDYGDHHHLPPEAVNIAQGSGFELHAVFGHTAKFRPKWEVGKQ
jgi:hypothetical protein